MGTENVWLSGQTERELRAVRDGEPVEPMSPFPDCAPNLIG